ncbi:MAG: hypothetical protein RXP91_04535 [Nitrososphaeria archaeon]
MSRALKLAAPLLGFATSAILTSALSTYALYLEYFHSRLGAPMPSLALWGSVLYFAGMPAGKVLGRALRFYRRLPSAALGMSALIAAALALMPFASSLAELMALRFLQGTVTFLMEIFSNAYSYLYEDFGTRTLASAVSISGIPGGVAMGTSAYILALANPFLVYSALAASALAAAAAYSLTLSRLGPALAPLRIESRGTTFRMGRTWLMGALWATIAGFNLVLAVALPPFVSSYAPSEVPLAMGAFGITAALLTVISGAVAYAIRSRAALSAIVSAGYALGFAGFAYLWMARPTGAWLVAAVALINAEALAVPYIYSIPRHIYPEGLAAKGTWEFALIGSTFHVWATALVLGIGYRVGFGAAMAILMGPPLYGMLASLAMPRLFRP